MSSRGSPELTRCTFTANTASGRGGAIITLGDLRLTDCVIMGNKAGNDGGGIYSSIYANPTLVRCILKDNSASDEGGAMVIEQGSVSRLANCAFTGNTAARGGAIYHNHVEAPEIMNCLFTRNSADQGGGLYNYASTPTITNCILWGDTPDEIEYKQASPKVSFSDIQGGWPGLGNIDKKPRFVTGPLGDFYLSHKKAGQNKNSRCINAGDGKAKKLGLKKTTTRTDGQKDKKAVDMGYHYPR
jgi:predicted outer membrane repeat protein